MAETPVAEATTPLYPPRLVLMHLLASAGTHCGNLARVFENFDEVRHGGAHIEGVTLRTTTFGDAMDWTDAMRREMNIPLPDNVNPQAIDLADGFLDRLQDALERIRRELGGQAGEEMDAMLNPGGRQWTIGCTKAVRRAEPLVAALRLIARNPSFVSASHRKNLAEAAESFDALRADVVASLERPMPSGPVQEARDRLAAVQVRVRMLIDQHPLIAAAMRQADEAYVGLVARHSAGAKAWNRTSRLCEDDEHAPDPGAAPLDPTTNDPSVLCHFREQDLRTIVLARLVNLADLGWIRPVITPERSDDSIASLKSEIVRSARRPTKDGSDELDPSKFPPTLAEQMLDFLMRWENPRIASDATVPIGWTKAQLLRKTNPQLGGTTFDRVRRAAGIAPGRRGQKDRRFTPEQVRKMIDAAHEEAPQTEHLIRNGWTPLIGSSAAPPHNHQSTT